MQCKKYYCTHCFSIHIHTPTYHLVINSTYNIELLLLQKLTKAFAQKDNSILTEKTIVWEDLVIENIPIHSNTRCVFYNGRLAQQPAQNLTIMVCCVLLKWAEVCAWSNVGIVWSLSKYSLYKNNSDHLMLFLMLEL